MKKDQLYKRTIVIAIIFALCLCCVGCSSESESVKFETEIPDKNIATVITAYFSAAEGNNIEEILDILYFRDENQTEKSAYEANFEAGIQPVSATVYSIDKINDSLYAITLDVEMSNEKDQPNDEPVYNFVALIDEEWRYILAQQNIPEEILDGADLSAFSYSNDAILSSDDVIA